VVAGFAKEAKGFRGGNELAEFGELFGLGELVNRVSEDEELSFGGVADVGRGDFAAVDVEGRDSGADVIAYGGVHGVVAAFLTMAAPQTAATVTDSSIWV